MTHGTYPTVIDLCNTLATESEQKNAYPLLCLPSTPFAFKLLDACIERGMPVIAAGHPALAAQWWPQATKYTMTPLTLWRKLKANRTLPGVTAVFQDQLVAVDNSYIQVHVMGHIYHVSPIECMVIARFRPAIRIGQLVVCGATGNPSQLALSSYPRALPGTPTRGDLDDLMADILAPLVALKDGTSSDWFASRLFTLKRDCNFNTVLFQQVQEMEALWRLYRQRHAESSDWMSSGDILKAAKANIADASR